MFTYQSIANNSEQKSYVGILINWSLYENSIFLLFQFFKNLDSFYLQNEIFMVFFRHWFY